MTHEPIAYIYEADHHCEDCARARFGEDEHGDITGIDSEGNEVGAVFPWDEWYNLDGQCETLVCGDCFAVLDEAHCFDCDKGEKCVIRQAEGRHK